MRRPKSVVLASFALLGNSITTTAQLLVPSIGPGECQPCYTATARPAQTPCRWNPACAVACAVPRGGPSAAADADVPRLPAMTTTITVPSPHPSCPHTSTYTLPTPPCVLRGCDCGPGPFPFPPRETVTRTAYTPLWCNTDPRLQPTPAAATTSTRRHLPLPVPTRRSSSSSCTSYTTRLEAWFCPMIVCARKPGCVVPPYPSPWPVSLPRPDPTIVLCGREEGCVSPPEPEPTELGAGTGDAEKRDGEKKALPGDDDDLVPSITIEGCTVVKHLPCPTLSCRPCYEPMYK